MCRGRNESAARGRPAAAHYSVAAEFDTSLLGQLEGEITQVWFSNPHDRYRLTVTNPDGTSEDWGLQAGNVTNLLRQSWTADSIKVGDRVKASGALGRDGAKKLNIREVVTADGRVPPPRAGKRTRPSRNEIEASADRYYGYGERRTDPIDVTGPLAQRLPLACDGRRPRAGADSVHGGRPAPLCGDGGVARPLPQSISSPPILELGILLSVRRLPEGPRAW